MSVKPIPDGYHSVTPYLIQSDAAGAIDFYCTNFGAVEIMRIPSPTGQIMHAEVRIGDSVVMLADEVPGTEIVSPETLGGTPASLMIYSENVDAVFEKAINAGATVRRPVQNQFYGDRSGTLVDPFGHVWTIATHVEDITPEELDRRMAEMK